MTTLTNLRTPTQLDAQAVFDAMRDGWNAADPAAVAATYALDGRIVDPLGFEWDGRPNVQAAFTDYFQGLLAGTTTEIEVTSVRALASGLAFVDCWQTFSTTLPPMRVAAVIRTDPDAGAALVVECRPYVLLEPPLES